MPFCHWPGGKASYMPFAAYRQTVAAELQSENVELWLFHGTEPWQL